MVQGDPDGFQPRARGKQLAEAVLIRVPRQVPQESHVLHGVHPQPRLAVRPLDRQGSAVEPVPVKRECRIEAFLRVKFHICNPTRLPGGVVQRHADVLQPRAAGEELCEANRLRELGDLVHKSYILRASKRPGRTLNGDDLCALRGRVVLALRPVPVILAASDGDDVPAAPVVGVPRLAHVPDVLRGQPLGLLGDELLEDGLKLHARIEEVLRAVETQDESA
mmetsp:Transcript_8271/g.19825  ORF Transcript_8271/g.19825 Transcript_8271/m.19825 type:complete len:222 (+) Transcript_8271:521-1186(+)